MSKLSDSKRDQNGPATRNYVRHETRTPAAKWITGLDLGQRRDHTALAILDLTWIERGRCPTYFSWLFEPQLTLRGLERVPTGTCYEEVHRIIAEKLEVLEQRLLAERWGAIPDRELVIDAGGPGPPMVDRLRRTVKGPIKITPVIITGGKGENTLTGGYTGIPRRTIVTELIQMISFQTIRCPRNLVGWEEFMAEMLELSGESTQPQGGAAHDDLVMSTGLAAWAAVNAIPELKPGGGGDNDNNGPIYGFVDKPLF